MRVWKVNFGNAHPWNVAFAVVVLGLHLVSLLALPPLQADELAYVCCGLALTVGVALCARLAWRSQGSVRYRWAFVTVTLALRTLNFFGAAAVLGGRLPGFLHIFGLWYSSVAFGIFAFALTAIYTAGSRFIRLFDLVLVFSLCSLRYAAEFEHGGIFPDTASLLNFILLTNIFFLVAATMSKLAARDGEESLFARLMIVYCSIQVVAAFCSNQVGYLWLHQRMASPWFLTSTLGGVAFNVVALHALGRPRPTVQRSPSLLALSVTPFFLALANVFMSIRLLPVHRSLGVAGIVTAVLCYAGRMIFLQSHYIRTQNDLLSRNSHLEGLIDCDPLTGIGNRRSLAPALDRHCAESFHTHMSVYLLLADIDGFKQANDNFGHVYGDRCLVDIAAALARELKPTQHHLLRYGGDEFAVVLRSANLHEALTVAEYLRSAVEDLQLGVMEEPLSASIGVAVATLPSPAIGSLIEAADRALYRAKQLGRNRVEFDLDTLPVPESPPLLQ